MACPVHFVEYEEGCKTCEAIVGNLLNKLRNIGLDIPYNLSWDEKIEIIHKNRDAVSEDFTAEIL